jgi:sirohydrochlorin cobaltochelatase
MTQRALILFAHGARAASWAAPFERLRDIVAAREPDVDVSLAFLELMTPGLPERAAQLVAQGVTELTVVPVFLGQGGHVLRDLPVMIGQIKRDHPALAVHVAEAAGENAAVLQAIADYCVGSMRDGA